MTTKAASATLSANPPENYERFFVPAIGAPLAVDLVRDAALKPGERVLDAACGTGVVARLAAKHVGPKGAVTGIDLNPGMLGVARKTVTDGPIQWQEANIESMPLPDSAYDAVFCQLSLQFVDDKKRALKEMRRVLKDGGRVLINLPGPRPELFGVLADGMEHHVSHEAGNFVRNVFSLNKKEELERMLKEAGFKDVKIKSYSKSMKLPTSREFLWQYAYGTPLAPLVAGVDDKARQRLEDEVVAGMKRFEGNGGMAYEQTVLVAEAHK